jgi:hypothetical protein
MTLSASVCGVLLGMLPIATVLAGEQVAPSFRVCFNYDCNRTREVRLSPGEWQVVVNQFRPAARSAAEERDMIRRAIAVLEHIAGTQTPTHRDRGGNAIPENNHGQMDCIDESTNTSSYLSRLEAHGLLRWHRVAERAYRAPYWIDVHWAGQIVEIATQDRYVVDSWFLDNGELPYVQALNDWLRKEPFE